MAKKRSFDVAYDGAFRLATNYLADHNPDAGFPARLEVDQSYADTLGPNGVPLTRSELQSMRDAIDFFLAGEPKAYVTVKIVGDHTEKEWHYENPGFDLKKDDLVRVNWGGATKIGIIRWPAATPPSWLVHIKPILAKFTAEEL